MQLNSAFPVARSKTRSCPCWLILCLFYFDKAGNLCGVLHFTQRGNLNTVASMGQLCCASSAQDLQVLLSQVVPVRTLAERTQVSLCGTPLFGLQSQHDHPHRCGHLTYHPRHHPRHHTSTAPYFHPRDLTNAIRYKATSRINHAKNGRIVFEDKRSSKERTKRNKSTDEADGPHDLNSPFWETVAPAVGLQLFALALFALFLNRRLQGQLKAKTHQGHILNMFRQALVALTFLTAKQAVKLKYVCPQNRKQSMVLACLQTRANLILCSSGRENNPRNFNTPLRLRVFCICMAKDRSTVAAHNYTMPTSLFSRCKHNLYKSIWTVF